MRPGFSILEEMDVGRMKLIGGLILAGVMLQGCATVTRGTTEAFVVETDPIGAQVKTSNGHFCESTPCAITMKHRSEFDVTISKEGYEDHVTHVTHQMAGSGGAGLAGNVLVGGIIGLGVDAMTGSAQELVPNPLIIKLTPVEE